MKRTAIYSRCSLDLAVKYLFIRREMYLVARYEFYFLIQPIGTFTWIKIYGPGFLRPRHKILSISGNVIR